MLDKFLVLLKKISSYLKQLHHLHLIRSSGLFDEGWYLANNPSVAKAKMDPLFHYLRQGGFEGCDPGANFSSKWYLDTYEDVKKAGINPLVHYLKQGKAEGRHRKPLYIDWQNARRSHPWMPGSKEFSTGINLVGYLRTAKGIAEAARSSLLALQAVKICCSIIDYKVGIPVHQLTEALPDSQLDQGFRFNTNLFHINPPQLPYLWETFKKSDLTGRYNIGVWYWELPDFPEEWRFAFNLVDEIWVASQFIMDSISAKSPVPVIKIPPCIHTVYDTRLQRSDYNLPADRFLFLCAYDVLSTQARKNPHGAVEAFKRAFPKNDSAVGLVIKINNARENSDEIKRLREELQNYSNCYFVEEILDRARMNSLLNLVDVYVSLHRSEGFGLIPAEAMSLGKPVVMTRWSGNLDLMTANNSCGVDYKLISLREQFGPYSPGQVWADPDLDQAAFFMQRLYSDAIYYASISEDASKGIRNRFSPDAIGQLVKERMQQIGLMQ